MPRRRRALGCLVSVVIPLLACTGAADLLASQSNEPIIAPGTPPASEAAAAAPCGDPCGMLLEHDFESLRAGGYCELCGDADPEACKGQWLGDLSCVQYDWLRNCIYARLGYDFDGSDWRGVFEEEAWYAPSSRFRWSDVTEQQVRNAKSLQRLVDKGQCGD